MEKKHLIILLLITSIIYSSTIVSSTNQYHSLEYCQKSINFKLHPFDSLNTLTIIYPRSSAPIIIKHNEPFTIQFATENFTEIFAYISTAYEPVIDEYWLPITSIYQENGKWYANATIPSNVEQELYNLTILLNRDGRFYSTKQPRAISVVSEITDDFTFIHISDLHIGDPRGFKENIRETIGWKSLLRCIHEINLLHPDFVLISGDLVYGNLHPWEYKWEYPKVYELLQRFDVPTYICPGNHDLYRRLTEDGLKIWNKLFGPLYYSFDYGDFHFLAVNSYDFPENLRWSIFRRARNIGGYIQDEQLNWVKQDLTNNNASLIFMFLHHNPLWYTQNSSAFKNREELLALINEYGVDMVLAGHIHYDTVNVVNNTLFITTTTPVSKTNVDGYWGYRLIHIEDGTIVSYNYKEPKYSIPTYKLQAKFQKNNEVIVTNNLEIGVSVLLRFVLQEGSYTVNKGSIILERSNGFQSELYVQVDIMQQSQLTIQLTKTLIN